MTINDADAAKHALLTENYFSIVNGYKDIFLENRKSEQYLAGTEFNHLYELFLFDRELRLFFLPWLLKIEARMRAVISHITSGYYSSNPEFYLQPNTYLEQKQKKAVEKMKRAHESDNLAIKHYRDNVGYIPFWVLVNKITFGNLSHFYASLKSDSLKNSIAKAYAIDVADWKSYNGMLTTHRLQRYLWVMANFRNVCAHDDRFYCHTIPRLRGSNQQTCRVSGLIQAVYALLPHSEKMEFFSGLNNLIHDFKNNSHVNKEIGEKVEDIMGMTDWTKAELLKLKAEMVRLENEINKMSRDEQ